MCRVSEVADVPLVIREARAWETMHQHLIDGIKKAKLNGTFGRHPKRINHDILLQFANSNCNQKRRIANQAGVSMSTMYRRLKRKEARI